MDEENTNIEENTNVIDIMDEFKEDFPMLIEGGFIAAKQLDEINSTRLFHAAQVINPKSSAPKVGLGHIALSKMDIKKATGIFEQALETDPENYLAQCFLGVCFLMTKDKMKKGEKLIQEAMEKTTDETVSNLGKVCLEWAAKDLSKRAKSPFEP